MRNERGGAIVLALLITILVSIGVATSLHISQNMVDAATRQKDALERERLASAMKTILGDQRFCGEFFPAGYNTAEGDYPLSPAATSGYPQSKLLELDGLFSVYQPGAIVLSDRRDLPPLPDGTRYRSFDLSVSIIPKTGLLGRIGAVFGRANEGIFGSKNWRLVVGNNNRCYIEGYDQFARQDVGVISGCKALGGVYENGRCHVNEYHSEYDGMLDMSKMNNSKSNFADALCAMELAALRKMGPHMINQSTASTMPGKMANGWTSLCAKPQWAGCRANGDANYTITHGNDPNSVAFRVAGETWTTSPIKINKKKFDEHMEAASEKTLMRRFNRVTGALMNESMSASTGIGERLNLYITNAVNNSKKLTISLSGGVVSAAATMGAIAHTLAAAWLGGPVGIAVAAVIYSLLPKCNDIRLTHTFQCADGYPELVEVKWEKQKLKVSLSGIKCKWKNGGVIPTPTETDIYSLVKGMGLINQIITEEDLEADISGYEDIIKDLENPNLTLADLVAMFNEEDSEDDEVLDYNIPKELSDALQAKEIELWGKFAAEANTLLAAMKEAPRAQGPSETEGEYQKYLKDLYSKHGSDLVNLRQQTEDYIAFSKSIKNADGTPRDFFATPVYNTHVSPLVSNINSTGEFLKSAAAAKGIDSLADLDFTVDL